MVFVDPPSPPSLLLPVNATNYPTDCVRWGMKDGKSAAGYFSSSDVTVVLLAAAAVCAAGGRGFLAHPGVIAWKWPSVLPLVTC